MDEAFLGAFFLFSLSFMDNFSSLTSKRERGEEEENKT
jgi:hypothetical protein